MGDPSILSDNWIDFLDTLDMVHDLLELNELNETIVRSESVNELQATYEGSFGTATLREIECQASCSVPVTGVQRNTQKGDSCSPDTPPIENEDGINIPGERIPGSPDIFADMDSGSEENESIGTYCTEIEKQCFQIPINPSVPDENIESGIPLSWIYPKDNSDATTHCSFVEKTQHLLASNTNIDVDGLDDIMANMPEVYPNSNDESNNQMLNKSITERIETVIVDVIKTIMKGEKVTFHSQKRSSGSNHFVSNDVVCLKDRNRSQVTKISSPHRVALMMSLFAKIYQLQKTNTTCTKRELYYDNPEFNRNQQTVDFAIRDISCILETPQWQLGILSSSKGLIAGRIKIFLPTNDVIDCSEIEGGILLPHLTTGIKSIETSATFVLIIEKDTVFEKLLQVGVLSKFQGNCILLTGKGYPDINSRSILKMIWDTYHLPMYALVDADPYGIEIMLTYRFGSLAMSQSSDYLAVPSIQWIGLLPSDIERYSLPSMAMNKGDMAKLHSIAKRACVTSPIYKEMYILEKGLRKAEIESLVQTFSADFLINDYLLNKMNNNLAI